MTHKKTALFEIFLLVSASIAFSYLVNQTEELSFPGNSNESLFVQKVRNLFFLAFGNNFVSAIESPLWTCPLDINGLQCQEYGSAVCNGNCTTSCFQGARGDFSECREGTCIDQTEGTCSPNTPQTLCTSSGGVWDARALTEIPACRPGCCLMGSQALFRTENACNALRARFNADVVFEPVTSELACLAMANQANEGACVLGEVEPDLYGCKLTTKEQCTSLSGTFYKGLLCSHPDLNTTCIRQATTNCAVGKDEVYWFDSCGNRENIYDSIRRDVSWNNGLILEKSASCELGSSNNPLLRQSSCGNCNYLLGNRCGTPRADVDNAPSQGSFVCRDLSCVDENGKTRKHGESWCAFNSRIGLQGAPESNEQRSTDVPGSEHFRQTCANGVITTETCGTFRNNICVESSIDGPGAQDFSQAACRPNQWQLCLAANQESEGIDNPIDAARVIKEACDTHTDCYLKTVDLKGSRGTFAFNVCLPKYAPGFNLQSSGNGEEAQAICSLATMACKQVKVKGLFGGGKEYNALCTQALGAETMNNFCTSLGDCGAEANIEGEYSSRGFRITTSRGQPPVFTNAYISGLRALTTPRQDQRVEPLSASEIALLLGAPHVSGTSGYTPEQAFNSLMMVSGMGGIMLAYAVYTAPGTIASISSYIGLTSIQTLPTNFVGPPATLPTLGGYAGAAAGALIGAAGTAYLLDALGISDGLPAPVRFALIGLGAFAGYALGGYASVGASFSSYALGVGLTTGGWALAVLVIIVAIFALLGIGKKKETNVKFQCLPWQPPLGGARCEQCGSDGLPCSQYQCQSLGQACRYLNQNGEAQCVNAGIDDVTAPFIQEDVSVLATGYRYTQASPLGYRLESSASDGCVPRFSSIRLGIVTNELAQCKVAREHTDNFESMEDYFHRANDNQNPLFRRNHTMQFSIPSNEAIQNEQAIDDEFDDEAGEQTQHYSNLFAPDANGNVNLYVRCSDATGNKNTQEYNINFCVTREPDLTAPIISSFNPLSPGYVALNATERGVRFWTNEPAACRWAESDRAFEGMTNEASCASSLGDGTPAGWMCNATLPAPVTQERTFYFRCADQPWLNATSDLTHRNMNNQGTLYVLKPTRAPLRITSVSPTASIFVLGLPARVNLSVTTSGGAEGQARYCSYRVGQHYIRFFETGGDMHRQSGLMLVGEGNYSYPLLCEDEVGNTATGEIRFGLRVDDQGPHITRVYSDNTQLTVVTNEFARCALSLASCSFNFVNGTLMSGNELTHTSPFNGDVSHYIYCRDQFDNPGSCTIVRGSAL